MKLALSILTTALLLAAPTSASAATGPTDTHINDEGGEVSKAEGKKRITFVDGDTLDGEVLRSEGANIYSATTRQHGSMIPIRTDFLDRLVALSNDV